MNRNYILFCFIILISSNVVGQIDSALFNEILLMRNEDQKWRNLSTRFRNNEIDTLSREIISQKIKLTDSLNYYRLESLVHEYKYLGYDKVGKDGSHNFWLLMQHQDMHPDFQEEVLGFMKIEVEGGNASGNDYAYLLDRVKVNTGKLQVYGTQMKLNADSTSYEPQPVENIENIDERRKQVCLPTLGRYVQIMNERYFGDLKKK